MTVCITLHLYGEQITKMLGSCSQYTFYQEKILLDDETFMKMLLKKSL